MSRHQGGQAPGTLLKPMISCKRRLTADLEPVAAGMPARSIAHPNEQQMTASSSLSAEERHVRSLSKKLEACHALAKRQAAGETLSQPERDKLAKADAWYCTLSLVPHDLLFRTLAVHCSFTRFRFAACMHMRVLLAFSLAHTPHS